MLLSGVPRTVIRGCRRAADRVWGGIDLMLPRVTGRETLSPGLARKGPTIVASTATSWHPPGYIEIAHGGRIAHHGECLTPPRRSGILQERQRTEAMMLILNKRRTCMT